MIDDEQQTSTISCNVSSLHIRLLLIDVFSSYIATSSSIEQQNRRSTRRRSANIHFCANHYVMHNVQRMYSSWTRDAGAFIDSNEKSSNRYLLSTNTDDQSESNNDHIETIVTSSMNENDIIVDSNICFVEYRFIILFVNSLIFEHSPLSYHWWYDRELAFV